MEEELPTEAFFAELVAMTNGGKTGANMFDVGSRIGVSPDVAHVIAMELKDQGLIIAGLGGGLILTSKGRAKGEGYNVSPSQAKPSVTAIINGPVTGSQIAVGTGDITQEKTTPPKEATLPKADNKHRTVDGMALFGICLTISGFFLIPPFDWFLGGVLAVALSAVLTVVTLLMLKRNNSTGH